MNYRHAFHAGNFADVLKHAVLALILEHLKRKDAPFRFIDTHAGAGLYDLSGPEAARTGEWRDGIGRLWGAGAEPPPPGLAGLLAPYFEVLSRFNPAGRLLRYPGSPALAAALLRSQDRLSLTELHPEEAASLRVHFARDRRAKVIELEGWLSLKAFLPPKERRGLVLVDPPFEVPGEFERLADGFFAALRRWPTGTYLLWYPVKDLGAVRRFVETVASKDGVPPTLRAELRVRTGAEGDGLGAAGLLVANPPYTLEQALALLGPWIGERLAQASGAGFEMEWVVGAAEPRRS